MKIEITWKVALDRLVKTCAAVSLLALAALPTQSQAELNTSDGGWVAGMVSSGTQPFDHLDANGEDNTVRTHDMVTYRVGFTTVGGSDTNAQLKLQAGSFTTPPQYTGTALSSAGYFDILDIPKTCVNIQQSAVSANPSADVSGITADAQTLFCAQQSPTNGNNLDFSYRISGSAPNGTVITPPVISYASDQTASSPAIQILDGVYGTETFYAMPDVTVRAEPRWNLRVVDNRAGVFVPASGPNGEDGFVFSWSLGVMGLGTRKGLEALQPPYNFSVDFNDSDFPNAQIVDWDMQNTGYISANFSDAGTAAHNGCGNWYNQLSVSGNVFDNRYHRPADPGYINGTLEYGVANGGDCQINTKDPANFNASFGTENTDFSLTHWPTRHGYNPAAITLVNPANTDDSSNEWWVANKSVLVWAPTDDITVNSTEFLTLTGNISGTSVSGQSNTDPDAADNSASPGATRRTSGRLSGVHTPAVWSNPFGQDFVVRDPVLNGDSHVNQVAPDQVLAIRLAAYNYSTGPLPAGYICDRVDNTRLRLMDIRDPAYATSSTNNKDPDTGVITRYRAGPEFPVNWQLGIGGTGTSASGTWPDYNSVGSEYSRPSYASTQQALTSCDDSDATWYDSIDQLIAAEGPDGLKKVTRVRGSYDAYPAGSRLLVYIPQQANAAYEYSGTDNLGGATQAFVAGDDTADSMAVHQMLWKTNEPLLFSNGDGRASDAVKIFQTEYVRISKHSDSHLPSGSLANVGDVINYSLTVNLSTSGSTHQSDVDVWDVLPSHLNYVSNSTTFGGAQIADPVCASSGLPTDLFPASDDVAAGSVELAAENLDRWVGQPWAETVTVESTTKLNALLTEAFAQGRTRWRQVNHPLTTGGDLPVQYTVLKLERPGRALALGRDMRAISSMQQRLLDAQQLIEREYRDLRHSDLRYRMLFQMASEAVIIIDVASKRVIEANPAAVDLLIRPGARLSGRTFPVGFDDEGSRIVSDLISRMLTIDDVDDVRAVVKSEERRVGKECRSRWSPYH